VVSPLAAAQPPTKLGLRAGETITVEDALHAMAVHSANDMAVAISEKIGGTESRSPP
jgi:D-alanyl-D-alanine carboxypeptidase